MEQNDNGLPDACNALLRIGAKDREQVLSRFGNREREVIRILCEGGWVEEIAHEFRISVSGARPIFRVVLFRLTRALQSVALTSGRRTRNTVTYWLDMPSGKVSA